MDHEKRAHLLSIGEMAEANRVSIATLRLYDRMGLLQPSYRDEETNYRYYDIRRPRGSISSGTCGIST